MAGNGLTDIEHRRDVRLQQAREGLCWKVLQRRAVLHAGIVYQYVDRTGLGFERIDRLTCGSVVGDVELQRPSTRDRLRRRLQLVAITPIQHNLCSGARQALGQRQADALG